MEKDIKAIQFLVNGDMPNILYMYEVGRANVVGITIYVNKTTVIITKSDGTKVYVQGLPYIARYA